LAITGRVGFAVEQRALGTAKGGEKEKKRNKWDIEVLPAVRISKHIEN
jgi:hypothetical protein